MLRAPSADLIDLIYDAAVEPQLWNRVLIEIADMLSSTSGVLCWTDQSLHGVNYFGRLDSEFNERHGVPIISESPWPWIPHTRKPLDGRAMERLFLKCGGRSRAYKL